VVQMSETLLTANDEQYKFIPQHSMQAILNQRQKNKESNIRKRIIDRSQRITIDLSRFVLFVSLVLRTNAPSGGLLV